MKFIDEFGVPEQTESEAPWELSEDPPPLEAVGYAWVCAERDVTMYRSRWIATEAEATLYFRKWKATAYAKAAYFMAGMAAAYFISLIVFDVSLIAGLALSSVIASMALSLLYYFKIYKMNRKINDYTGDDRCSAPRRDTIERKLK